MAQSDSQRGHGERSKVAGAMTARVPGNFGGQILTLSIILTINACAGIPVG
jgi:hypothetical protein